MAEVLGAMNLLNKALPVGVDGTRLAEWAMKDGVTYGELVNATSLALGDANQQLVNKWGWLFGFTEDLMQEYEDGGSVSPMQELTDIDKPQPLFGSTIGHMIDLRYYGQGVGGSKRYFRDARSSQVRASISAIVRRGIWRFEQKLLTRAFTDDENQIGTAGYDVPFVNGTGGNVDYTPPAYEGQVFAGSHSHYVGYNASTPKTMADVLDGLALHLAEHGHEAPYTAIVSNADTALFSALTKWVQLVAGTGVMIDRGGGTSGPQFFAQGNGSINQIGYYQSTYGQVDVRISARVATGHVFMGKSYGQLDIRNPLAVRVHPQRGFGMAVVPETTNDIEFPIKQLDVDFEFGVGVGPDRTNGVHGFLVAGGTYADSVIT